MKLVNSNNYGSVGAFENTQEPVTTSGGAQAFLVSNYAGLYGVAVGSIYRARLLLITDSWEVANSYHQSLGVSSERS